MDKMRNELTNCLQHVPPGSAASIGIFILIIFISFYYSYLTCSCDGRTFRCNEFMAVPFFIVFFLILLIDRTFRRTAKHAAILSGVVVKRVIRAILFGLLWVVAVLIHGDWYFCCKIDQKHITLPCKTNLTTEEAATKAETINTSKITGYTLLLGIIVAALLTSWSGWRQVCEKKLGLYSRKTLYYQVVLEEEEKILEELLRRAVNENLTKEIMNNINRKDWDGCLYAAEEMINEAKQQKPRATKEYIRWTSVESATGGEQAEQRAAHQQAQSLELQSV
ncbi:uncharacterized protein LOC115783518 [Archocentrus centrarchus]|uniref:uncharacterized protein LOC115783518 n=1 Tax=Archocentrus centrarchus TaxID=63155 RepID=UPI0011E9CB16|nr:uncharacterized protein LOC115783518 [Archocentrus centrarchus]XP_030590242.1 uncharacterized protein LOC115783518 [Archocentrus centrarchus]